LLVKNPDERPSAEVGLKHPWLNQQHKSDDAVQIDTAVLQNMKAFALGNTMKRAALGLIAYSMSTREVEDLEAQFHKIDKDHTGTITLNELALVLIERLHITPKEAKRIFEKMDQTGDAEVHYSEFLASTLQAKIVVDDSLVREAFKKFDVDGTGFISIENLRQVLGDHYNGTMIEEILSSCDYKGNGFIDYDEFLKALTSDEVGSVTSSCDDIVQDSSDENTPFTVKSSTAYKAQNELSRRVLDLAERAAAERTRPEGAPQSIN